MVGTYINAWFLIISRANKTVVTCMTLGGTASHGAYSLTTCGCTSGNSKARWMCIGSHALALPWMGRGGNLPWGTSCSRRKGSRYMYRLQRACGTSWLVKDLELLTLYRRHQLSKLPSLNSFNSIYYYLNHSIYITTTFIHYSVKNWMNNGHNNNKDEHDHTHINTVLIATPHTHTHTQTHRERERERERGKEREREREREKRERRERGRERQRDSTSGQVYKKKALPWPAAAKGVQSMQWSACASLKFHWSDAGLVNAG